MRQEHRPPAEQLRSVVIIDCFHCLYLFFNCSFSEYTVGSVPLCTLLVNPPRTVAALLFPHGKGSSLSVCPLPLQYQESWRSSILPCMLPPVTTAEYSTQMIHIS
jgi:hypothetical protein